MTSWKLPFARNNHCLLIMKLFLIIIVLLITNYGKFCFLINPINQTFSVNFVYNSSEKKRLKSWHQGKLDMPFNYQIKPYLMFVRL